MTQRYAASISYRGDLFRGWQAQEGQKTVQLAVNEALYPFGAVGSCCGAGRTDAGVHARSQIVHFDLAGRWDASELRNGIAAHLPPGVDVMKLAPVGDDFHARKSAKWREYRYFVWNSAAMYPHLRGMVWQIKRPLPWDEVSRTVRNFQGIHDFGAFCRKEDRPEVTCRHMFVSKCALKGPAVIFTFRASGFMTNMVRILVGTAVQLARGNRDSASVLGLLNDGVREEAGGTAPPDGLFLWKVGYDVQLWNQHQ